MDIGNRIKQLRMKKNLTLEELASRCELSKGFLSQLERNLTSPSIATLEDITEVLGVDLATFFKEESDVRISYTKDDYYVLEKEDSTITWLVPEAQNNEMEPILYKLDPHAKTFEIKPYEGEEFGYVLRGSIVIKDITNNEEYVLKKGDTFYLKGDDEHYIENTSEREAIFIWICTPPIF